MLILIFFCQLNRWLCPLISVLIYKETDFFFVIFDLLMRIFITYFNFFYFARMLPVFKRNFLYSSSINQGDYIEG